MYICRTYWVASWGMMLVNIAEDLNNSNVTSKVKSSTKDMHA